MRELIVSTEGQSEDAFVRTALQPHLQNFGLYTKSVLLGTGRGRNGGWRKFSDLEKEIRELIHSPANRNAFITTMYDFADIQKGFPEYEAICELRDKYKAVVRAEALLQCSFSRDRFIPHFQLHQFESLIFTAPAILLREFPDKKPAVDALAHTCNEYDGNPELINSTEKPSYRIAAALNVEVGAFKGNLIGNLAKEIGIDALRRSCHHFDQWLCRLETLA